MPRNKRIVYEGVPHHVTHRGSRRDPVFYDDRDYFTYRTILAECCTKYGCEIWAYCLMPNHVHLLIVPEKESSLSKTIGVAHKKYSDYLRRSKDVLGTIWETRFSSFPVDDEHLFQVAKYIEKNPVVDGLIAYAGDYRWSSSKGHLGIWKDKLLSKDLPLLNLFGDWKEYLENPTKKEIERLIYEHERTYRPLGKF